MQTIDKIKVDEIIDGLLENNDLAASPEVWYGLHQIKKLPVTEIVRCGECELKLVCCRTIRSDGRRADDFCSCGIREERKTDD